MAYANFEGFEWLAADIKNWVETKAKITATSTTEARTLPERFAEIVNVKDFGAVGDGIVDDTNAIQSAINIGSNKLIFFPAGTYIISDNIVIEQNGLSLIGEGSKASIIIRQGNADENSGGVVIQNCSGIAIRSMGFNGNRDNQSRVCVGIEFKSTGGGVSDVILSDLDVFSWGKQTGNYGQDNFSSGVVLYSASNIIVTNCNFYNNAHYGINTFECSDVLIKNCISSSNLGHAFGSANCTRFVCSGNTAYANATDGLWFRNIKSGVIVGNTVNVLCNTSIELPGSLALNGIIIAGRDEGIRYLSDVVISNNVINIDRDNALTGSTFYGIVVQSETGVRVKDVKISNNIITNADYGTRIINVDFCSVSDNIIKNAYLYALYLDGLNMGDCSDNNIFNCKQHGIYSSSRYTAICRNRISTSELDGDDIYYGIYINGKANNYISDNYIYCGDNSISPANSNKFLYGIYLDNTSFNGNRVIKNIYLSSPQRECVGAVAGYDLLVNNTVEYNWSSSKQLTTIQSGEFYVHNPYKTGNSGIVLTAKNDSNADYRHGLYSNERNKWMIYGKGSEDGVFLAGSPVAADNSDKIPTTYWTNQLIKNTIHPNSAAVSASDIDLSSSNVFTKTISEDTTFTISNAPAGKTASFLLIVTNAGAYNITWPASVKWANGTPPGLSASGTDVLAFVTPNGGTTWYGMIDIANAA